MKRVSQKLGGLQHPWEAGPALHLQKSCTDNLLVPCIRYSQQGGRDVSGHAHHHYKLLYLTLLQRHRRGVGLTPLYKSLLVLLCLPSVQQVHYKTCSKHAALRSHRGTGKRKEAAGTGHPHCQSCKDSSAPVPRYSHCSMTRSKSEPARDTRLLHSLHADSCLV